MAGAAFQMSRLNPLAPPGRGDAGVEITPIPLEPGQGWHIDSRSARKLMIETPAHLGATLSTL